MTSLSSFGSYVLMGVALGTGFWVARKFTNYIDMNLLMTDPDIRRMVGSEQLDLTQTIKGK